MDIKFLLLNFGFFSLCWCLSFFILFNIVGKITEVLLIFSIVIGFLLCTCTCCCFQSFNKELNNMEQSKVLPV